MRRIERAIAFKRDYRRARLIPRYRTLERRLAVILELLVNDRALPPWSRDHALSGEWSGYRDCHVSPDLLLLIYAKPVASCAAARQGWFPQRAVRVARSATLLPVQRREEVGSATGQIRPELPCGLAESSGDRPIFQWSEGI